jgi:GNAT superfamily N-acetyltransferase
VITAAGYRFLFEEMLCWSMANWAERGPRFLIEITEKQDLEIEALERAGFRRSGSYYSARFDLSRPLRPARPLEPGFRIVDMAAHPDYRGQRIMRNEAFSGRVNLSEDELAGDLEWHLGYQVNPIYHAPTDLVVVADDGLIVAGCEALIDAHNCEADVERVCTHSAYRRRGFARAVIQECLQRLKQMGMYRAAIAGYSREAIGLYSSLGAQSEMTFYSYETSGV